MEVSDVAANGYMCGEGHTRLICGAEQRVVAVPRIQRQQRAAQRFSESDSIFCALAGSLVQQLASLFSAAKRTVAECRVNIFRSRSDHRDLCVMDQHRAVTGD